MKYTIEGFSQEYAYSLRNDKQKVDFTDLVILRWFVDFYPKMQKIVVDDKTYAWVSYGKLLEDLPMLDITKRALRDRLQKLCEFGILIHHVFRKGGVFSCYGFGENYQHLVGSKVQENADREKSTSTGKVQSTSTAFGSQLPNKDNSIINNSIIDSSLSANKRKKFVPPTLEEVQEYAKEKALVIDPKFFYEYFTEGDWHDKKGDPVKNWKTKMLTWNRTELDKHPEKKQTTKLKIL